jgi:DtxR family Mn-dependent transcriptional regulator
VGRFTAVFELYVQTVFEIAEDGGCATQPTIARRMNRSHSAIHDSTVRACDAGLVHSDPGHGVTLTTAGAAVAVTVVRRHRILECFLHDVVGLDWTLLHDEARRWQHVVSDRVEAKISDLLGAPRVSPYGCAVPAPATPHVARPRPTRRLADIADGGATDVVVQGISEHLQSDLLLLRTLVRAGAAPGMQIRATRADSGHSVIVQGRDADTFRLPIVTAAGIWTTTTDSRS